MQERAEDERHPERDGVYADLLEQENAGEDPDHGSLYGVEQVVFFACAAFLAVAFELCVEPLFFRLGEPVGVVGMVLHEEEDGDAEEDGGQAFDEEEPLPAQPGRRCLRA